MITTLALGIGTTVYTLGRHQARRSKKSHLLVRLSFLLTIVPLSLSSCSSQQSNEQKGYAAGPRMAHVRGNHIADASRQSNEQKGYTSGPRMAHVRGNHIVDASGQPLMLRGGQIPGLFNSVHIARTQAQVFPTTVQVMHDQWRMNVLRLPTCNWLWQADPTNYMSRLQTAVQQANQAGLYVIIDNFDNAICSPPYSSDDTYHLPRPGMDSYMRALATTFKNNPLVIFDVYNEPSIRGKWRTRYTNADWNIWLKGGTVNGETFIGMQKLVDTIRATGAQQIIMVEGLAWGETFYNIGTNVVSDPLNNIVYQAHWYNLETTPSVWDSTFGFMSSNYPVFVGEWGLLAGGNNGNINCNDIPQSQADQTVTNFLNYMASHNMGWAAFSFTQGEMVLNYSNYTPSTFHVPSSTWCNPSGQAGMGEDVQRYLLAHQ